MLKLFLFFFPLTFIALIYIFIFPILISCALDFCYYDECWNRTSFTKCYFCFDISMLICLGSL